MKIIKKFCLALKRIVLGIINFVDRFIIVPVTKLILMFTEKSNKNGMKFEQFLMKKKYFNICFSNPCDIVFLFS